MTPVWWKEAEQVENTCKCNGNCLCRPAGKSAVKHVPRTSTMYSNENGTSYALTWLAATVGKYFGHVFGAYTLSEQDGKLVIHTELTRDDKIERILKERECRQPCSGNCETSCERSTREVAGL